MEATGAGGAVVNYTPPPAWDAASPPAVVVCNPAPNTTFGLGTTLVRCNATDAVGNWNSTSFEITVGAFLSCAVRRAPLRPPQAGRALSTHTLLLPAAPLWHALPPTTGDNTAADLTQLGNTSAEATGPGGAIVPFTVPIANDTVSGLLDVTCNATINNALVTVRSNETVFPLGATLVNCSAIDAAGNAASSSFYVIVGECLVCVGMPRPPVATLASWRGLHS